MGTINRVSSNKDVIGDEKYMEFSDKNSIQFPGQHARTYIFYRDEKAYQTSEKEQERLSQTPDWFTNLDLPEFS